jgi:ATP-dependent helicase/DNAse subunit B
MHEFSIEQFQYAMTLNSKEVIFTGTIDRVDLNYQNDVLQIGIVDYKSSDKKMKVTDDNTKGEHSFQMLIYLKAIKEIIKNNYELILNDKGITLNDDNVDFKYAYYYNLKSFEKATDCMKFYALQKINEKEPEKSIIIKDSLNFQEKLLSETYNRILEKNFEFNGNKNKYDEDVNLMIRY